MRYSQFMYGAVMIVGLVAGGLFAWRIRRLGRVFGRPGGSPAYRVANITVAAGVVIIVGAMVCGIVGPSRNTPNAELPAGVTIGLVFMLGGAFAAGLTRPSKGQIARRRRRMLLGRTKSRPPRDDD